MQVHPYGDKWGVDMTATDVLMVGIEPMRVSRARARAALQAHGAVIVTGCPTDPEGLVGLAAATLGSRLRQLFPIRPQHGVDRPALDLHSDGADVVVDVHGQLTRLRDPDEDYLFVLCAAPAAAGGDSIVVDGYALVDALQTERPELHAFLTGCDVDYFGGWDTRGREVPSTPLVRRLVEYTRTGRRVVRAGRFASPVPREPRWDDPREAHVLTVRSSDAW